MRGFRLTLFACTALALAGFGLALWGRSQPVFTVPFGDASALFVEWCSPETLVDDAVGARYLALFGWHYWLIDLGVSLIAGAATLAGLATLLRLRSDVEGGEPWLRTPRARWVYLLCGLGVVGWTWQAAIAGLEVDLQRQIFPSCADSIAIPIMGLNTLFLLLTPILLILGWIVTLSFGALPASLFAWDPTRPKRSWIVTLLWGLIFVAVAAGTVLELPTSANITTPANLIALYLIASTRAAMTASRGPATGPAAHLAP